MMPIAMPYETPENAAAEIRYLENHKYPISYIKMGEESDGQYMQPEDYGALYLQFATALRKVDPNLKLGGPSFEDVNEDVEVWPDAEGRTSWLSRFLLYLRRHNRMQDLQFISSEPRLLHQPTASAVLSCAVDPTANRSSQMAQTSYSPAASDTTYAVKRPVGE